MKKLKPEKTYSPRVLFLHMMPPEHTDSPNFHSPRPPLLALPRAPGSQESAASPTPLPRSLHRALPSFPHTPCDKEPGNPRSSQEPWKRLLPPSEITLNCPISVKKGRCMILSQISLLKENYLGTVLVLLPATGGYSGADFICNEPQNQSKCQRLLLLC